MFPTCAGKTPSIILNDVQKQEINESDGWMTDFKIINGDPRKKYILYQNVHMIYNVSHKHLMSFDTKYSEAWLYDPGKSRDSILVPKIARRNGKGSIKIDAYAWIDQEPLDEAFRKNNVVYAGILHSKLNFKTPPKNTPILHRIFFARWNNLGLSDDRLKNGRDICLVDRIMNYV